MRWLAVLSQVLCKVPYCGPERVPTDLKKLVVTTSLNGEEGYWIARPRCLCQALGHGKGHQFVLGPMSDEDRVSYPADLAHIVEALPDEEAHDRFRDPGEHGMGLLRGS